MGIARNSIEDLKKRTKISDFILSTTTGKLRGSKGMALCPFHGEKTASMSFTDVENLFHCFGCKMGGDVFKYIQEINNLEFQDAVEFVADNYGFKLSYTSTGQNEDFKKYQSKMNIIIDYFKEMMESKVSKKAVDYLNSRGFDSKDIKKYNISFIDSDVEKFQKYCKKNEIQIMDERKKDAVYELGCCFESMGDQDKAIEEFKVVYSADISFRDVADKINAFYSKSR